MVVWWGNYIAKGVGRVGWTLGWVWIVFVLIRQAVFLGRRVGGWRRCVFGVSGSIGSIRNICLGLVFDIEHAFL